MIVTETPMPSRSADRASHLRLYTHNIYARRADWNSRRRLLADGIAVLDPDIVVLQEEVVTSSYDQTADLARGRHIAHSQARSRDERSGISIASRWPITAVHEIDLTVDGPPVDEYVWASLIVEIDGPPPLDRFIVANHFPDATVDREHERERHAVAVTQRIHELADADDLPVVLAGDLDAEPDSASLRFLTGRQSLNGSSEAYVSAPGRPCTPVNPAGPWTRSTLSTPPSSRDGPTIRSITSWCAAAGQAPHRFGSMPANASTRAHATTYGQVITSVWSPTCRLTLPMLHTRRQRHSRRREAVPRWTLGSPSPQRPLS